MKKSFALGVLLCLLLFWPGQLSASGQEKMTVGAGQSRTVNMSGLQRAAIANPDVADVVVVSSSELILVGKQTGTTTLIIWSNMGRQTYQVEVAATDPAIANEIKRVLGYPDIRVVKVNKTVILEGTVNDQYQRARAEKIAAAYGDKVDNLLEIAKPIQIKIEAKIVEISRNKTDKLGLQYYSTNTANPGIFFAGQYQNSVLQGTAISLGNLGAVAPLNTQLNLLLQNGFAKLLSQPNMVTLSGEKANILVGGQIPVPAGGCETGADGQGGDPRRDRDAARGIRRRRPRRNPDRRRFWLQDGRGADYPDRTVPGTIPGTYHDDWQQCACGSTAVSARRQDGGKTEACVYHRARAGTFACHAPEIQRIIFGQDVF